jgi:hypothetical protein
MMKSKRMRTIAIVTALVSALSGSAMSAQDKYTLKVPGGLAFSEFKGYEHATSMPVLQVEDQPRQSVEGPICDLRTTWGSVPETSTISLRVRAIIHPCA